MEFAILDFRTFGKNKFLINDTALFRASVPNLNLSNKKLLLHIPELNQNAGGRLIGPVDVCTAYFYELFPGQDGILNTNDDIIGNVVQVVNPGCNGTGPALPENSFGNGFGSSGTGGSSGGTGSTGSGSGGPSGGGYGSSGWAQYFMPAVLQVSTMLNLNDEDKYWLNTQTPAVALSILEFLNEESNLDPDEDDNVPVNTNAHKAAKAFIANAKANLLFTYNLASFNNIAFFSPTIIGTPAQQADIFWSNFSLYAATSKDEYPNKSSFYHWQKAFYFSYFHGIHNIGNGIKIGDANDNNVYNVSGVGLNATFNYLYPNNPNDPLAVDTFLKEKIQCPDGGFTTLLTYKKNNKVVFGSSDDVIRAQGRRLLGLVPNDGIICHHIMPIAVAQGSNASSALQKLGEKGLFHLNFGYNLEPVSKIQQPGPHPQYDAKVKAELQDLWNTYQNDIPELQIRVTDYINYVKGKIRANPDTPLNNLVF
jgi:hypothetical protein